MTKNEILEKIEDLQRLQKTLEEKKEKASREKCAFMSFSELAEIHKNGSRAELEEARKKYHTEAEARKKFYIEHEKKVDEISGKIADIKTLIKIYTENYKYIVISEIEEKAPETMAKFNGKKAGKKTLEKLGEALSTDRARVAASHDISPEWLTIYIYFKEIHESIERTMYRAIDRETNKIKNNNDFKLNHYKYIEDPEKLMEENKKAKKEIESKKAELKKLMKDFNARQPEAVELYNWNF